jgi:endo-1,4-beta-xylanase
LDERELMASANDRIRDARSADFTLTFVDDQGAPVRHAEVGVTLVNHAFRFGCNGFLVRSSPDPSLQDAYGAHFAALLNYATLPFYWGGYERAPGETRESHLHEMAGWCKLHDIATKGHPLVWHEVFPQWANGLADEEVLTRLETRVRTIPTQFRGEVEIWDVVNEATVSPRYDNMVGRWVARNGTADAVERALHWARTGNPEATLIYNDFNLSEAFESLVAELLDRGAPLDAIGVQSHMHQGAWSMEKAWDVCQTYGRFGLPLHFTELTILSGDLKSNEDNDWHTRKPVWLSTPEGEAAQAEIGVQLYTLLFSHPAVEAITWWDFSDLGAWMGAPSGLLRADMSPKPLYERLMTLVRGEWRTNVRTDTGDYGVIRCRCFYGTHRVTAMLPSGDVVTAMFQAERSGDRAISVALPIPNAG